MKVRGQILWNVTPICETSQISCLMGRHHMKDVLENLQKDQSFCEGPIENTSIWFKSLVRFFSLNMRCTRRESGKETSWTERSLRKFLEPSEKKSRKSFTLTTHQNLANPVKIYHGITELQHLIDPRRTALRKERCEEWKKLHCCNQAWMKDGGQILWHAVAICEMFKTSWQMGKLFVKGDSENNLKDQSLRLARWLNIIRFLHENNQGFTNLVRQFHLECSSDMRESRVEKKDASEIRPRRINATEVLTPLWGEDFVPSRWWYSKIVRRRPRIPRIHSKAGTTCGESRSQYKSLRRTGRTSTDRIKRWRWSPGTSGRFKVTSSIVITLNLVFSHLCRKKKHSPWATYTNLDVLQEKRNDDEYWIVVDENRSSSVSRKGLTMFSLVEEKPPKGKMWSGERMTINQATARPEIVWLGIWIKIGEAAQKREK